MKRRSLLLLALLVACVIGSAGTAGAVDGEKRLLVALLTWGPQPYPAAQAREVLDETASFIDDASFGRVTVVGDTTPWLRAFERRPAQCNATTIMQTANAELTRAGYDRADYTLVVYAFPRVDACPWGGAYFGGQIQLNGRMDRQVLAHELGHISGVQEEGPAWVCSAGRCRQENYASPYSVMGHGLGDFSAYEKHAFGWIDSVARPEGSGNYEVMAIDRRGSGPHALHVLAAGDEYWIEFRPPSPLWDPDEPTAVPGLAVYGGPHGLDGSLSRFPVRNLLIRNPVGGRRSAIRTGERYRVPGAFEVSLAEMGPDRAVAAFRWLDRKRPARVAIIQPSAKAGSRPVVRWQSPPDRGSGIGAYEIRVDGGPARRLPAVRGLDRVLIAAPLQMPLGRLAPGPHRVVVVAVDRAGNRSAAASRRFVVRG
jgi:hypothetical protein